MKLEERPIAWRSLLAIGLAQFVLHLATSGRYGIFRDEYYYLACAARPDWGYVDHPPLSIWILQGWKTVCGVSSHALGILPALCGSVLVVMTGALTARLGGGKWAQIVAGLAVAVGMAGLVLCSFYSMNAFDLLFWAGAYFTLVVIVGSGDGRLWIRLGLILGIGLLNKVGLLVFGVAMVLALAVTGHRRHFNDRRLYLAGGLALAFLVPYLVWNAVHGWPTPEFIANAKEFKISDMPPGAFLTEIVLEANPFTLPLWLGGLGWLLLGRRARNYRIIGLVFLFSLAIMMLQKSKPYYMAASFPVLLAAGAAAWEQWTAERGGRWVRGLLTGTLATGGLIFLPMGLPLLSLEDFLAYQGKLGIIPQTGEDTPGDQAPQYFSDRFGWEELAAAAAKAVAALPVAERSACVILAGNYGHAGALEYWAERYGLPSVYSGHNNYWLWGPPPLMTGTVIAVGFDPGDLTEAFAEVVSAGESRVPTARESRIDIFVCRGFQLDRDAGWDRLKRFI